LAKIAVLYSKNKTGTNEAELGKVLADIYQDYAKHD
jgi:hypothetical protein